jgi:hypothetical protein
MRKRHTLRSPLPRREWGSVCRSPARCLLPARELLSATRRAGVSPTVSRHSARDLHGRKNRNATFHPCGKSSTQHANTIRSLPHACAACARGPLCVIAFVFQIPWEESDFAACAEPTCEALCELSCILARCARIVAEDSDTGCGQDAAGGCVRRPSRTALPGGDHLTFRTSSARWRQTAWSGPG